MGGMPTDSSPAPPLNARSLRAVRVRPTWGLEERRRWDDLVEKHHYLPFQGLVGRGLRHVAELDGQWVALVGMAGGRLQAEGAGPLDRMDPRAAVPGRHLIANNTRFVLLPGPHRPNLASRVLGLSLRRLSSDMRQLHGHPVLVAETFVDPSRFAGTCYRASNWLSSHDPGLPASARRQRPLVPSRSTQGDLPVPLASRCLPTTESTRRRPRLVQPGRIATPQRRPAALPVRVSASSRSASPGASATRWPPCWRWRWLPASPAIAA